MSSPLPPDDAPRRSHPDDAPTERLRPVEPVPPSAVAPASPVAAVPAGPAHSSTVIETDRTDMTERRGRDWTPIILGVLAGLLLGAIGTYFLTKEKEESQANDRVERVENQRERSRDENRRLRRQLDGREAAVTGAQREAETEEERAARARDRAGERVSNVEEALSLVQDTKYDSARDEVADSGEDAVATIKRATADNLAARAMKAILDERRDDARELVQQGRDYPTTPLASDARESYRDSSSDDGSSTSDESSSTTE